jgi:homoserine kinase
MTRPPSGREAGPVRVRVPATSANLGPGFDSLGLALTLYDDIEVEVVPEGLSIEVIGEGAEVADRGENHLIVKVIRRTFDVIEHRAADARPRSGDRSRPGDRPPQPGLRLRCVNRIPHSRGLGSSAAAIVAGAVAARALHPHGAVLDDQAVFALATEIEGHPDNVAPCLAGGLTIAWRSPDGPRLARIGVDMEVVVFVPQQRVATERARGLLPEVVPHADAAANAGRAALLIAALTACRPAAPNPQAVPAARATAAPHAAPAIPATPATPANSVTAGAAPPIPGSSETFDTPGNPNSDTQEIPAIRGFSGAPSTALGTIGPAALLAATDDRLHQDYRAPAMPESAALLSRLRKRGIPAVLSGAGPTVLAFTTASQVDSTGSEVGNGWHKRPLNVDPDGARVQLRRP